MQLPLYASVSGIGWNLVGAPLGEPSSTDDFRVANDVSGYPCSTGCDLNPAVTAGQITGPVWIFDSSTSGYIDARVAGNVTSGQGFWMATLPPAKDTQPILYVPGSATACSLCVPPDGDKANDGACANTPLESVQTAIDLMSAGDTLCLMQGVYRAPVVLADKTGSATHPITIRVMPGDEGQVQIRGSIRSLQTGLEVCNSYNVNVIGLDIQQVLRGIQFNSVSGGSVDSNLVSNIEHGMEPRIKQVNSNP